jgi:enoyl-CoA hydratase/carnithine racemase
MNFPSYATLALEMVEPHVLVIKLNRPEVANAINTQMGHDMLDLWRRLTDNSGDVRCAILTGTGDKIFCAGGDLKERNGMTKQQWVAQHELFERAYWTLVEVPVPIIAAINGHAYAGGLETALACDFLYAANTARFALTEVSIGIMPGGGGTQNLPRAVGERRAKEIILTAKPFSAQQAADWGLVNRVCEPAELMPAALETARAIAGNAPLSIRQAKKSIHFGLQMELKTAYRFEVEAYNHLVETEDRYEGIRAFNEKRKPVFKGK